MRLPLAAVLTTAVVAAVGGTAPGPGGRAAARRAVDTRERRLGWFPIDRAPVLTVRSGDTVRIDTLSHAGATQAADPERYLGQFGVAPEEVLQDVLDFWRTRSERLREGRSGHVITGPIYIEDAEPGDVLEVQVLALRTRVPYGINNTGPASGVLGPGYPGTAAEDEPFPGMPAVRHFIRTGEAGGREVAFFLRHGPGTARAVHGIMAVAPESPAVGQPGVTLAGVQASRPPGPFGGNLDVKDLAAGSTLYLPVFHPGARFYVGDPHSAQGDGEVSGTAIEQSLSGDFRFVLHKDRSRRAARRERGAPHPDGDRSRPRPRAAQGGGGDGRLPRRGAGLTRSQAFSLASIAVDFRVAEAVDLTQVVTAFVPKAVFLEP